MTFSFPALVLTRRALPALVLFDFQKEKESHVGLQAMSTIQQQQKKIGLEHVSNIISQKTSNSFSDYQPKGYLKRHNLIHVFFLCRHFQNLSFTNNVLEFYNFYHVNKYLAK